MKGCVLLVFGLMGCAAAHAEGPARWALAIGNVSYSPPAVSRLPKSSKDAVDIAKKLISLNFSVTPLTDADGDSLVNAVLALRDKIKQDDIVVVYFSGHGFQHNDNNFIVPVGARLDELAVLDRENIPVNWIVETLMERRPGAILVFLDACRQVVFPTRNGQSKGVSIQTGMQHVQVPAGVLVGYAASPGHVSWAGGDEVSHSIYTEELLASLDAEDTDILSLLTDVRREVLHATGYDQITADDNRLLGTLYLKPGPVARMREEVAWANLGTTPDLVTAFIEKFPGGRHIPEARAILDGVHPPAELTSQQLRSRQTLSLDGILRESRITEWTPAPRWTLEPRQPPVPIGAPVKVFGTGEVLIRKDQSPGAPLLAMVSPSTELRIIGLPPAGVTGWAQVMTPDGLIGFVDGVTPSRQIVFATVGTEIPFGAGQLVPDQSMLRSRVVGALGGAPAKQHVEIRVPASAKETSVLGQQTAFIRAVSIRSTLVQMGLPNDQISILLLPPEKDATGPDIVARVEVSKP